ncbi:toll/interleukin-1 receptor (TIR) domain-containing protein [Artemisia annua]|uniref:Toll/interleukin-1 receptor (TIR) domain-containing protein n=1 Tax=Artemisia annua TaxID=35608 RepID=A0A2U1PKM2_ARTAN|nr:toll/interleukin-1 receptor (TIR) domain-containing protein [Artemisia annua]
MASTLNSSIEESFKYDVFLSFRGGDTRNNFVGHLYQALQRNCIETYKDDKKIEQGKPIKDQLIKSIEDSRFYIIVFSKTYASSSWCLDELVKIMECKKMAEQNVYPVFYDVEPTEVRKQSGAVKEAFAEHEKNEAAGKWREAMKEASNLAGWELKATTNGDESELIQIIVNVIFKKKYSTLSNADGKLVGMETRISDVLSSLEISTEDVRMIGIKGIGGGGKTTLARAVYDQISNHFEGKSFVENVREVSQRSGLKKLQKRILKDVLNKQDITFSSVHDGKNMLKDMMSRRKTLVVLDDVDRIEQLEAYAFKREIPTRGYEELSGQVVQYAQGLPLTIKVLGLFLCDQKQAEWIDAIKRLKTIPLEATMKILEISFDGLENDYKEIFLDVACILKGWNKNYAIRALESCGFHAEVDRILGMHDHIQEMGRNIVRRSHPYEPQRHSRLWVKEEIEDILTNDLGTQATKCLYLESPGFSAEIALKGLAKMKDLRFIHIDLEEDYEYYFMSNIVQLWEFDKVSEYLPSSLRSMRWPRFPFSSLPNTFQGKYLVELDIHHSNIVHLWEDGEEKVLHKLRFLTFMWSKLQTFDLRLAPNLERLNILACDDFVELHMPAHHLKLKYLDLSHSKLRTPHLGDIPYLEELILDGCHTKLKTIDLRNSLNLKKLILKGCTHLVELQMPAESPKLDWVDLGHSKLKNLQPGNTPNLKMLILEGCNDLVELQMPDESLNLKYLDLSHSKLKTIHLENTPNLETLILEGCYDLVELQMPDESLNLKYLDLSHSKLKTIHLENTPNLERLRLKGCNDLVELLMPDESLNLKYLDISHSKLKTIHLRSTPNLKTLILKGCNDLLELQMPVENLKLEELNLSHSKLKTIHLGNTPNLVTLILEGCNDLVELQMPVENLKLEELNLSHSKLKTIHLGNTPNLMTLILKGCNDLVELQMPVESLKLEDLNLSHSKLRILDFGLTPNLKRLNLENCNCLVDINAPVGCLKIGRLVFLEELNFSSTDIRILSDSICMLNQLKSLEIVSCWLLEKLPEDLGRLQCLEKLILTDCKVLQDLPNSICKMKSLISLHLDERRRIMKLPEEIGRLDCLQELDMTRSGISCLPTGIFQLKGLRIVGEYQQLRSFGFTSEIQISENKATVTITVLTLMASTSSSINQKSFKYDVFLSFRGEDTRKNFVDHLYHALTQKGIETYKDDEDIKQGKMISDELIKAIEDSKFYIIIFSKSYASSSWCLEELVKIMECRKDFGHTVYPVFYDVEPTEVRKQSESVKDAFAKLNKEEEAARKWREAMKEASDLAGWELKNTFDGHEAKFIQKIVQEISLELRSINFGLDEKLVGMETRVKDVVSSLETSVSDVRMLGIWGMGGSGKTTLARAVFDQISFLFEGQSFVENVREESKPSLSGLKSLLKQVISDISNDQGVTVSGVFDGKNKMKKMMRDRKVLVVLDDVNHKDQLEALAGDCNWFKPGSRIIITTREKQVLVAHGVRLVHNVTLLSQAEAGCLFSRYAFGRENPIQGYEELSGKVLKYAHGLPLTVKVLGSFLCGQSEPYWIDAIERLKKIPLTATMDRLEISFDALEKEYKEIFLDVACILKDWRKVDAIRVLESRGFHAKVGLRVLEQTSLVIERLKKIPLTATMDRLEISFDALEKEYKEIFLDVACILKDWRKVDAIRVLESRGFHAKVGLRVLEQTSLVTISSDKYERLGMHDHLEEMGRNIVRRLHPDEPNKHSRLWIDKEIEDILANDMGTEATKCIYLRSRDLSVEKSCVEIAIKGLAKMKDLRFIHINLLEDYYFYSNIVQFDKVSEYLPSSLQFIRWWGFPFSSLPNKFHGKNLVELDIHGSNIVQLWEDGEGKVLHKLKFLDIRFSELRTFDLRLAPNLEQLTIKHCYDFVELHMPVDHHPKLEYLTLAYSKLTNIHLRNTPNLKKLNLKCCYDLVEFQMLDESLKLEHLDLSHSNMTNLHLRNTPNLKTLVLHGCNDLVELQMPAESLKLEQLDLSHSKLTNLHLGNTPNLKILVLDSCTDLVKLQMPAKSLKLELLDLSHSKLTNLHLGNTPNLKKLILKCCYDLVEFQMPAESLKLEHLDLSHLKLTNLHLGNTPNLKKLILDGCSDSVELQPPAESSNRSTSVIQNINARVGCLKIDQLVFLEELNFSSTDIRILPDSICMLNQLQLLETVSCWLLKKLPEDLGRLQCLKKLILTDCKMKSLISLHLDGCLRIMKLPEKMGRLKELDITRSGISYLPTDIFQLKGLCIVGEDQQLQNLVLHLRYKYLRILQAHKAVVSFDGSGSESVSRMVGSLDGSGCGSFGRKYRGGDGGKGQQQWWLCCSSSSNCRGAGYADAGGRSNGPAVAVLCGGKMKIYTCNTD